MNAQDLPDERIGPETDIDEATGDAGTASARRKVSPVSTDDDTEGQGGKVFAHDGSEAEDAARP